MAVPTFVNAGAGAGTTGTSLAVPYPASLQADDFLLVQLGFTSASGNQATYTVPADWTEKQAREGPDTLCEQAIITKKATGSESGNLTITVATPGTNTVAFGRMYAFRGVHTTTATEGGAALTGTDASVEAPSLTTTSTDRLGLCFVYQGDDTNTMASFTGESNGDWVEVIAEFLDGTGLDGGLQLQSASLASATTISGGSLTFGTGAEKWVARTFALIPAPASQSATPSAVTVPISIPTPTIVLGEIAATPSPVTVPIVIPDPVVSGGGASQEATPDPVTVPVIVPTISLSSSLTITPDPVTIPITIVAPTISGNLEVLPSPVAIIILIPTPAGSITSLLYVPQEFVRCIGNQGFHFIVCVPHGWYYILGDLSDY